MGLYRHATASVIRDNTLDRNDHGILGAASSRNSIRIDHNRLIDNGDGIIATLAHGNVISHNTVTGTGFFGFPDTGGFGLILDGADSNTVDSNTITGGRGPAIFVTSLDAPTPSRRNVVSRNVVSSKLSDGILVNNGATGTLIVRNTARRSGDDGIDIDVRATTVTRNTADDNHDFGIEAVPGRNRWRWKQGRRQR